MWFENQFGSVWKCKVEEKVALVNLSTSRKDNDGGYLNSSWGDYVRFVGQARFKADALSQAVIENGANSDGRTRKPVRIKILKGTFSKESWVDSTGVTKYPKNPTITVFDFEFSTPPASQPSQAPDEVPQVTDEEEFPF